MPDPSGVTTDFSGVVEWLSQHNPFSGGGGKSDPNAQKPAAAPTTPTNTAPEQPSYQTLFNPLAIQTFISQFLAPYINKPGSSAGDAAKQLGGMGYKLNPAMVKSAQDVQGADLSALLHQVDPQTIQFLQDYTNQVSQVKASNQAMRDNYLYDLRNYLSGSTGSGSVPGLNVSGANLLPAISQLIQQQPQPTGK